MPESPKQLFVSAGLVCVSYIGLTNVASVAEEIKSPERNLPLRILLTLLTAVLVYGRGVFVIVGVVPRPNCTWGQPLT